MAKHVDANSFADELSSLIGDGISEILAEGLDVECPACEKEFTLDFSNPKCPFCGQAVKVEF